MRLAFFEKEDVYYFALIMHYPVAFPKLKLGLQPSISPGFSPV